MHEGQRGTRVSSPPARGSLLPVSRLLVAAGLISAFLLGRSSKARSTPALVETPSLRDAREVERSLGLLEARLLQGESWVEEQSDLKRRHEQVSALACESAELHARDSARVAINARRNALRREAAAAVALDEDDESPLPEQSPAAGSLDGRRLASAPPDLRPGRATAP